MKPHKIYASDLDNATLDQFYRALEQDFCVRGALMPDAHLGYSLPIGAVVATSGVILPSWVGYDIGCGMCAVPTSFDGDQVRRQATQIFAAIYRAVPVGFSHNRNDTPWDYQHIARTPVVDRLLAKNGLKQLGSLGSGNHFIEIGSDESGGSGLLSTPARATLATVLQATT
jgi:tRNA-splicing ligase RtcB (3'-phosphate/5'-hydroxy nucleic acid ligase)